MRDLSAKKLLILGLGSILLVAVPLVVFFIGRQQKLESQATPATTLTFTPASTQTTPLQKKTGETITLDVTVNPGTNIVNLLKLNITYDQAKLTPSKISPCNTFFCPVTTSSLIPIGDGPTNTTPGVISVSLASSDPLKAIQTPTKIGTLYFDAKAVTDTTPTQVAFGANTAATSSNCDFAAPGANNCPDQPGENVLLTSGLLPTFIAIAQGITPTPSGGQLQSPTCTGLNIDRAATGTAPYSLTFTANGTTPNTSINKVTFDFGDGPALAVTQGTGIGTKTVSIQTAHTYNNPGTFKTTATITDNTGAPSTITTACTQTITVTTAQTTGGGNTGVSTATPSATAVVVTATPVPAQPTALPQKTFTTEPGPGNAVIITGVVGGILTIIGATLFFLL